MTVLYDPMTLGHSPALSVITPVLNGERFISGCLENVLAQECAEIEHLIVDGGSGDGTEAIVREWVARHGSIRWIQERGANQSRALNLGIEQSRGRVAGILNVDDFYEAAALPRVLELFENLPSPSLLVGNCNAWEGDSLLYVNRPTDLRFEKLLLGPDFYPFPFNPAGYFYDASLHKLVGPYDVADDYSMDLDFLLRAVRVADVTYVDETWGNYRVHPEAKTVRDREVGAHARRLNRLLRRHRRLLRPQQRASVYAELALRRSELALKRFRWRLGAARAALQSRG
jgi:glycosyltransferase involved in cell wall biosynthesis